MKKLVIITIIMLWNININGQSNASKEETIDWLNTYVEQLENGFEYFNNPKGNFRAPGYNVDFYVFEKNNMAFFKWEESVKDKYIDGYKVNKNSVKRTPMNKIRWILLTPKKEYSETWYDMTIMYNGGMDNYSPMKFYFSDKKSSIRVFKAMKKLASFYNTNIKFEDRVSLGNKF
jgi:hypothetical protein